MSTKAFRKNTSRSKYARGGKANRVIKAKFRNSGNYDLNDKEYIIPKTKDEVIFGGIALDRNLTEHVNSMYQMEIPGGEKKSSRRQSQKNNEVNPLEVAQILQGQSTRLGQSHGASMEVDQMPNNSMTGGVEPESVRVSSASRHQVHLEPRLDTTRSSGAHHSKPHHLQSEKPHSTMQGLRNGFKGVAKIAVNITTGLKAMYSSPDKSSSSGLSSSTRNGGAVKARPRKPQEVVDLCNDDGEGGQFDLDESDGESTTTERSAEVPSSTEVQHSGTHGSEVTSRGSTSVSRSEVSSDSPSTSATNRETSSASMVASAAAATAMKNSQDSTLSSEDTERLKTSAEGPSRAQGRFALKDTGDLLSGDTLSVEEDCVNVCDTLGYISKEPYTASCLSTTSTHYSLSDDSDLCFPAKKARTQSTSRKDPPELQVKWGASALPKKSMTSEGTGIGRFTKANGMCLQSCD